MAGIILNDVTKVYPNGFRALEDFSLNIKDREFLVLVGPSGCGKSTILRIIAGLEKASAGEVIIGDRMVNDVLPKERNISMVFQNYALYPHMNVYENMAFSLKLRKMNKKEIKEKILNIARTLEIEDILYKKLEAVELVGADKMIYFDRRGLKLISKVSQETEIVRGCSYTLYCRRRDIHYFDSGEGGRLK